MVILIVLLVSFCITLISLRLLLLFLSKKRIKTRIDNKQERKDLRPRLGGIGIFSGFISGILLLLILNEINTHFKIDLSTIRGFYFYIPAVSAIFLLGLIDDLVGLNAWQKLPVEFILAAFLYFNGFAVKIISLPFAQGKLELPVLISFSITIFWIVGITNAMNLIDGIDGLAGSIAIVTSISFILISIINQRPEIAILAATIIGPLTAFLIYNFFPAKLYMGDSGSLFLGFFLAVLSIKASNKASFGIAFIVPIFVLFVPIFDTVSSFFRRAIRGGNPFKPDFEHLHHKLIEKGNNEKNVLFILISWTFFFSIIGVLSALMPKNLRLLLVCFIILLSLLVLFFLKYLKLNGLLSKLGRLSGIKLRR